MHLKPADSLNTPETQQTNRGRPKKEFCLSVQGTAATKYGQKLYLVYSCVRGTGPMNLLRK